MSQPTLLLLDFQEAIVRTDGPVGGASGLAAEIARRGVLARARAVLDHFRARNWPVAFIRVAFDDNYHNLTSGSARFANMRKAGLMRASDPWSHICSELTPLATEPVVSKGCVNPFIGTNLAQLLNRLQPSELVLAGVATNHVVESTTRHAADSGFKVIVLEDVCASFSQEAHEASVKHNLPLYAELKQSADYMAA